ncbi:MAG: DUF4388 domain-containing protein [Polyangiales bacterium]
MPRPLVVVFGANEAKASELARSWADAVPALEFTAVTNGRDMLNALAKRATAALVVTADAIAEHSGSVAEVARKYPATAVLVLGGDAPRTSIARPAAMLSLDASDHEAVLSFLREDVLNATRGSLSGVALASVLQVLHFEGRTCTLRVRSLRRTGVLVMRNGALVHAEYRDLSPQQAALELLSWSNADVVFAPAPSVSTPSITASLDFLLLEAARLHDERSSQPSRSESILPPLSAVSTSDWRLPALMRGDAGPMLEEIIKLPGARVAELVDTENNLLLARRAAEGEALIAPDRVASIARAVLELSIDQDMSDWMEEIVLNFSTRFTIIRPLRVAPNLVLCVSFLHKVITLGLAKTVVAQAIDRAMGEPER